MPIYTYRCTSCGHAKDVLQKVSDPLLSDCPACGAATFAKQVTAAGFQLKGSGWYVTDFRGGNNAAAKPVGGEAADGEKAAETTAEKSWEKSAEKKADDKAAAKPSDGGSADKAPAPATAASPAPTAAAAAPVAPAAPAAPPKSSSPTPPARGG